MEEDYENEEDLPEDEQERDVYKKSYRESLFEDDEISPEEEGFMQGYEEDEEESQSKE